MQEINISTTIAILSIRRIKQIFKITQISFMCTHLCTYVHLVDTNKPSCDRLLLNARQRVLVTRVRVDDQYACKQMPHCHSRCGTLKNPHCSMALSAEHRSTFAALHRQWCRLWMREKFFNGTKNSIKKHTKKIRKKTIRVSVRAIQC